MTQARERAEDAALRAAREEIADAHGFLDRAGVPSGSLIVRIVALRDQRDDAIEAVIRLREDEG